MAIAVRRRRGLKADGEEHHLAVGLRLGDSQRIQRRIDLTPAAIQNILESPDVRKLGAIRIDGFVGPAHVSTVIGTRP